MIHNAVACNHLTIVVAVDAAVVGACLLVGIGVKVGGEVIFAWRDDLAEFRWSEIHLQSVVAGVR